MIRFFDSFILAHTKLRTHRIRTAIIVIVSGLLFGLMLAVIFVSQGAFESFQRFSKEGLSSRALVALGRYEQPYPVYDHLEDAAFITKVEQRHKEIVDIKTKAAKKFSVPYDAKQSDPSPVTIDNKTGRKSISFEDMENEAVRDVAEVLAAQESKPFDMQTYLKDYPSAKILSDNLRLQYVNGTALAFMDKGRDAMFQTQAELNRSQMSGEQPSLAVINQSIADPFINTSVKFDPAKGEIPVIMAFKSAEKRLGLKPLTQKASNSERLARLQEVRKRIGEVSGSFCYRNAASQQLLGIALSQRDEMKRNEGNKEYIAPALQYKLPDSTSCGATEIAKDTRSAAEKRAAENYILYEKEIGTHLGEPAQQKLFVRAVGVSGDSPDAMNTFDIASTVQSMMGSWVTYGESWVIPANMLKSIPESSRPAAIFGGLGDISKTQFPRGGGIEDWIVEFGDLNEARSLLAKSGPLSPSGGSFTNGGVSANQFGSGMLVIEELKSRFTELLLWALLVVGGIAVVILGSIIGRAVSEGRRESAIFRAIGARRIDIGTVYGVYALLLSLRVALFALILGLAVALVVEILFGETATIGAQYAYAASELTTRFSFISIMTWLAPMVLGATVVAGMIAAIIPMIRSARRNPINDMRDDT